MSFIRTAMAAAAIAALALPAYADTMSSSMSKPLTVALKAQNGSGETGTATLTQAGANLKVVIKIDKPVAAAQPVHIHPGTCAKLNPAPQWALMNIVNGMSTTTLKGVKLATLTAGSFAINVHKSTADLKTYVACGDIK